MLPPIDYPDRAAFSDHAIAIYELAAIGWSNDYIALGLGIGPNVVENELRAIRASGFKIIRPSNTLCTFCTAVGISAVVSRYAFHMAKTIDEVEIVSRLAKKFGRSELWVSAMIKLYQEHVIAPARELIDGGEKTVAELVRDDNQATKRRSKA